MLTNFFRTIVKRIPEQQHLAQLFRLSDQFLEQSGWNLSARLEKPVDKQGNPIPWLTYSSIHFLQKRLHKDLSLFEYGSGNSTLWFSSRVKTIVSVEHHEEWYNYVKDNLRQKGNISYLFKALDEGYAEEILSSGSAYDLVLIDGRKRVDCAQFAVQALSDRGVIIWDNSERERYQTGLKRLRDSGFSQLDFFGLNPGSKNSSTTTIFYRAGNCLGI